MPYFNQCGLQALIAKKRPGTIAIINGQQALQLTDFIDQPQHAQRSFWTAKAFDGCITKAYHIHCSDETVVGVFHKQGYQEKLIERLHQAIDVLNNPKKTQNTACIGTLL